VILIVADAHKGFRLVSRWMDGKSENPKPQFAMHEGNEANESQN